MMFILFTHLVEVKSFGYKFLEHQLSANTNIQQKDVQLYKNQH